MPLPGDILGGVYQIVDEIGKGGAGVIYRAYHLNLQKYVVVKKIKDNFVGVLNARGEVDILKALHHTYLPQVYDFIQMGNEIYTVMEYIDGKDLNYYIKNGYSFDEATLWKWIMQLCEVLDYLHKHGILHLDIKPANIMVTQEGDICLIDFNISLPDMSNEIAGISQIYSSPEQFQKWIGTLYATEDRLIVLDERTDIYSLGATFYEMMTGYQPSPRQGEMIPLESFQLNYSKMLVNMIAKMLKYDRRKRFLNMEKIRNEIRHVMRSENEKNTLRTVFGVMLASIIILFTFFGAIIYRNYGMVTREERLRVQEKEIELAELIENGEYEKAYQEGVQFINVDGELLDKLKGAKQSIFEKILDASIGMENYAVARTYVTELLKIEQKTEYYQDSAIIEAYSENYDLAQEYIDKAKAVGGSSNDIQRLEAEIYVAKEEYEQAILLYEQLYQIDNNISYLRKIAELNLKASLQEEAGSKKASSFLLEAISKYEDIEKLGFATFEDQKNLVQAYIKANWNDRALTLLSQMSKQYPDYYYLYRDMAIIQYNQEIKKNLSERNFSKVRDNANKAKELMKKNAINENDDQLENLLDILEALP